MFKHIKDMAVKASQKLAKERGEAPDMEGTGMRHSHLMAIAPNATSGIFLNTSPSIEPWTGNAFTQKTLSGSFLVTNKHFENLLRTKYKMSEDEVETVMLDVVSTLGSVQHLDFLTEDEKEIFKTAPEINQRFVVEHAAQRQEFICQAQSLNLFFSSKITLKELHEVHYLAWQKGLKTLYYLRSEALSRAAKIKVVEDSDCVACEG
jgi:ribonucleoside-diphosphate reductase alpha chain